MFQTTKCLQCCGEYKLFFVRKENGTLQPGTKMPPLQDAITMAPAWQKTQVANQMVMACVAVPTCEEHLEVNEMSAVDRAMMGGRLIQGSAG